MAHDRRTQSPLGASGLGPTAASWNKLRAAIADCDAQGVGLLEIHRAYLALGYAGVGEFESSLALAGEVLAKIEARNLLVFLSEAHRVRGEILAKRDPANPTPAEEELQAAIAIAKRQATRSFQLRAALTLAKLYQSTGRANDAYDVLTPALEAFSPTPEMPEIAEAHALMECLP